MLTIKRLNLDSSLHIEYGKNSFVVDPWLIGSEIDGFKWLNEQWHIKEPVKISDLPEFQFLLISQNYEDHCHIETLKNISDKKPIIATDKAFKKLKKKFPNRKILHLKENEKTEFKGLSFISFRPDKILDPIYYAVVIINKDKEAIFYAPHGFALSSKQLEIINKYSVSLLITTFTEFEIPKIMGGKVNPGMDNVYELFNQIKPKNTINTHDEEKKTKGLVSALAKIKYADYDEIESNNSINFIRVDNYDKRIIK